MYNKVELKNRVTLEGRLRLGSQASRRKPESFICDVITWGALFITRSNRSNIYSDLSWPAWRWPCTKTEFVDIYIIDLALERTHWLICSNIVTSSVTWAHNIYIYIYICIYIYIHTQNCGSGITRKSPIHSSNMAKRSFGSLLCLVFLLLARGVSPNGGEDLKAGLEKLGGDNCKSLFDAVSIAFNFETCRGRICCCLLLFARDLLLWYWESQFPALKMGQIPVPNVLLYPDPQIIALNISKYRRQMRNSLDQKLISRSLDRSYKQARPAGAVLALTIPSDILPFVLIALYNALRRKVLGAVHTKIDLSWIHLRSISVRFEKVFTLI